MSDKNKKRKDEINEEKKFLQSRFRYIKALEKDDKEEEEDKEEKSYILTRWKALMDEEKDMGSMITNPIGTLTGGGDSSSEGDSKSLKSSPAKMFADKFNRNKKSFLETHTFLKAMAQEEKEEEEEEEEKKDKKKDDYEHSEEDRHKAYHLGRMMEKAIGDLFGGSSADEDTGKKELTKLLIKHKDFPELKQQDDEMSLTHPNGPSKYTPGDKLQHFGEGGSLVKKKDFPELTSQDSDVNVTSSKNPPKIAKLGEDVSWNPIEDGPSLVRKKKDFPELEEEDRRTNLTEPSGPSHYNPGQEEMQHFGRGGTIVKFLKTVAEAGIFLKNMAFERAFGMGHRDAARRLVKAMDEPFVAEFESIFPGDLANLLQEEDEPEHKKDKKKEEKNLKKKDFPGNEMGLGDRDEEEEQDDPLGGDLMGLGGEEENMEGLPGDLGEKSLNTLYQDSLRQTQTVNGLQKSLNDLLARIS